MSIEINNRFEILAITIIEHLKRNQNNIDTRLFRCIVSESFITIGESKCGRNYKEHVVPCAFLRQHIIHLFYENSDSIENARFEIVQFLKTHLKIVLISKEESKRLDLKYGGKDLKNKMPDKWKVGDDIFARLKEAEISFFLYEDFANAS